MKKTLFGIVCFRESFWKSESFISLIDSYKIAAVSQDINIFIFDNTDIKDWNLNHPDYDIQIKINYVHYHTNPGISVAYNHIAEFAKNNNFDWIVFLDQDSKLPINAYEKYENFASKNDWGIAVPKVYSNNILISPSYYKYYRSPLIKNEIRDSLFFKNITCINSGLMIDVHNFFFCGGYNNKLRIDFCDHEFISRVSKKLEHLNILNFKISQDLSTHTNDLSKAVFRYKIFNKDLKTYSKIINESITVFLMVDLPTLVRLTFQYKSLLFFKERISKY